MSSERFQVQLHKISWHLALFCLTLLISACHPARNLTVTLSVAASLQDSVTEVEAAYKRDHEIDFRNNFGASGTLAQEIEQGAPVDAFISAGTKPMDQVEAQGLLLAGSRRNLFRNSLVLVAPSGSALRGFEGLTGNQIHIIALGDPGSVPAGQYGKQTLKSLHLNDKLKSKFVLGKDVRQVLTYVETGDANAGLVYATDAQTSKLVQVVGVAPEESHDAIVYPVGMIKGSQNESTVRDFINFLRSPAARAIFERHGFRMA